MNEEEGRKRGRSLRGGGLQKQSQDLKTKFTTKGKQGDLKKTNVRGEKERGEKKMR